MASSQDDPSWQEIERAWVRPRRSPPKWQRDWHRAMWVTTRAIFVLWVVVAVGIETSMILDVSFHLGWGYKATDPVYGGLLIVLGLVGFCFVWLIHGLVGWIGGVSNGE